MGFRGGGGVSSTPAGIGFINWMLDCVHLRYKLYLFVSFHYDLNL